MNFNFPRNLDIEQSLGYKEPMERALASNPTNDIRNWMSRPPTSITWRLAENAFDFPFFVRTGTHYTTQENFLIYLGNPT